MSKVQTVGSAERAKDAVKETVDSAIGEVRMEPVRKIGALWARIQNAFSGVTEAFRGK